MASAKRRRRKDQRAYEARQAAYRALATAGAYSEPTTRSCPITDISTLVCSPEDVMRAGTATEPSKWVVVSCSPMGERKAIASLRERRLWAYLPMQRFCRWSRGKKTVIERPLMVGYLFAILPKGWHPDDMMSIAGIDGVLKSNGRAAEINPWTLVQLGALEATGAFDHSGETKSPFTEGQAVKIMGGQFMGWLAKIVTIDGHQLRVELDGKFKGVLLMKEEHLSPVHQEAA